MASLYYSLRHRFVDHRPATTEAPVASGKPKYIVPEGEAPRRTFIAKLNLRPRLQNGRVDGYIVDPADPSIFEGTPLQASDVLLEMDGTRLDAARVAALGQNVGNYQDVFIRFGRDASEQEGMLPPGLVTKLSSTWPS